MIYELIMAMMVLFIGALSWYAMDQIVAGIFDKMVIPANVSGGWIGFMLAVKNWFPLIVVLSLLMWIIYQSQRPRYLTGGY